jgi:hypothetical protein
MFVVNSYLVGCLARSLWKFFHSTNIITIIAQYTHFPVINLRSFLIVLSQEQWNRWVVQSPIISLVSLVLRIVSLLSVCSECSIEILIRFILIGLSFVEKVMGRHLRKIS